MNSPSYYLRDLKISSENYIEIQSKELDKIFITDTSEGYGYLQRTEKLAKDINPKKLYPIADGFLYKDRSIWAPIPEENIYCDPLISFWWVWNRIWPGDVKDLIKNYTTEREYKFLSLNNNNKVGREALVDESSDKFIEENWISGYFSERKGLRNFDKETKVNTPPEKFYPILFQDHCNKGYIQLFFESPGRDDGITDYMLMITEKSCIPFLIGTIAIPLNMFYVSEYEKLGFKFVKEINGVSINETIEWDLKDEMYDKTHPSHPKNWLNRQVKKIDKINKENSLEDIKKVFLENEDIIIHNQKLVMELMTGDEPMKKMRDWMLK